MRFGDAEIGEHQGGGFGLHRAAAIGMQGELAGRDIMLLFDTAARITGPRARTILMPEPTSTTTVAKFTPAFAPLNPRLLDLYDTVADRLGLIHHCLDGRRIHNGQLHRDMSYFGDDPLREGWRPVSDTCDDETDWWCIEGSSVHQRSLSTPHDSESAARLKRSRYILASPCVHIRTRRVGT